MDLNDLCYLQLAKDTVFLVSANTEKYVIIYSSVNDRSDIVKYECGDSYSFIDGMA
jgi:hypothetical protein